MVGRGWTSLWLSRSPAWESSPCVVTTRWRPTMWRGSCHGIQSTRSSTCCSTRIGTCRGAPRGTSGRSPHAWTCAVRTRPSLASFAGRLGECRLRSQLIGHGTFTSLPSIEGGRSGLELSGLAERLSVAWAWFQRNLTTTMKPGETRRTGVGATIPGLLREYPDLINFPPEFVEFSGWCRNSCTPEGCGIYIYYT